MSNPTDLFYSRDHEWVRIEGDTATIGITDFAQKQLGDIVFVELPGVSAAVERSATVGTIESVKSVSELFSPVAGVISASNETIVASPELVNQDPYGEGWLFKVRLSDHDTAELMDAAKYDKFTGSED